MKLLIVLSCEVPKPEDVPEILEYIDPPNLPHFTGEVRVVPEPFSEELIEWLDEDDD